MPEGRMSGEGSKIKGSDSELATKLAALESRRDALTEWMKRDSTPDDVRLLDDLNRQIQAMEEQLGVRE